MKSIFLNYGLFQAGWFACVFGAAHDLTWLGLAMVFLATTVHLVAARQRLREAGLLLICALVGLGFDSALLLTGWVEYPDGGWVEGLAPIWIVAMWVLFGTTLNQSLAWMKGRPWLALIFGVIGGPLSYFAGERLGAMTMNQPLAAAFALAAGWGVLLPLLFAAAARLDGFAPPRHPGYVMTSWRVLGRSGHA